MGSALLAELVRRCLTANLVATTERCDLPAQCLLEKCGFVPVPVERLGPAAARDDERVYVKPITRATSTGPTEPEEPTALPTDVHAHDLKYN